MYDSGAIYISSKVKTEDDFKRDLVHEIAHSFEESKPEEIYEDGSIQKEFLKKRKHLFSILKNQGYPVIFSDFENINFDPKMDEFLYNTVTYDKLATLTNGIFISPYAATSLREYYANSFEEFFIGSSKTVKDISPAVFEKIATYLDY